MKEKFFNNKTLKKMNNTIREIIAVVGSMLLLLTISYLIFSALCDSFNGL